MKLKILALAAGIVAITPLAFAQVKPEKQIEYRQASMTVLARSNAELGAMAKGSIPFNKDVALRHANLIAGLSDLALEMGAYGPGTEKGAHTEADPKIWSDPAKFKAAFEKFAAAAKELPAAAGDKATLGPALKKVGMTCKGCHDDFRSK